MSHNSLVHMPIPIPKAMKNPEAKVAVDKGWGKLRRMWRESKVRSTNEVISEAQKDGKTVHFVTLRDFRIG